MYKFIPALTLLTSFISDVLEETTATSNLNAFTYADPSIIKALPISTSNVYMLKFSLSVTCFRRVFDVLYIL